jgi:hypothetical protein
VVVALGRPSPRQAGHPAITRGAKAAPPGDTVICSVNPRLGQLREPFWTPAPELASLASVRPCQQSEDPLCRSVFGRQIEEFAVALSIHSVWIGRVGSADPNIRLFHRTAVCLGALLRPVLDPQPTWGCWVVPRVRKSGERDSPGRIP